LAIDVGIKTILPFFNTSLLILFPIKDKNKLIALNNHNNNALSERDPFVCLTIVVGRKKQTKSPHQTPLDPTPLLN